MEFLEAEAKKKAQQIRVNRRARRVGRGSFLLALGLLALQIGLAIERGWESWAVAPFTMVGFLFFFCAAIGCAVLDEGDYGE